VPRVTSALSSATVHSRAPTSPAAGVDTYASLLTDRGACEVLSWGVDARQGLTDRGTCQVLTDRGTCQVLTDRGRASGLDRSWDVSSLDRS
jgi:hypothetical protein